VKGRGLGVTPLFSMGWDDPWFLYGMIYYSSGRRIASRVVSMHEGTFPGCGIGFQGPAEEHLRSATEFWDSDTRHLIFFSLAFIRQRNRVAGAIGSCLVHLHLCKPHRTSNILLGSVKRVTFTVDFVEDEDVNGRGIRNGLGMNTSGWDGMGWGLWVSWSSRYLMAWHGMVWCASNK